mmetsp:Transcript_4922/g.11736  ORF Transcript_4922/g.11736 Transcript_4922/m.11736 type:complete len:80 (-) Transcript_4922:181-420(-)
MPSKSISPTRECAEDHSDGQGSGGADDRRWHMNLRHRFGHFVRNFSGQCLAEFLVDGSHHFFCVRTQPVIPAFQKGTNG